MPKSRSRLVKPQIHCPDLFWKRSLSSWLRGRKRPFTRPVEDYFRHRQHGLSSTLIRCERAGETGFGQLWKKAAGRLSGSITKATGSVFGIGDGGYAPSNHGDDAQAWRHTSSVSVIRDINGLSINWFVVPIGGHITLYHASVINDDVLGPE